MQIQLGEITPANVQQLRILNSSTLPVRYSDKFYKDIVSTYSQDYMKFAFCNGFVVGAVCARLEDFPSDELPNRKRLYIMTINVLSAYRRRGIGKDCTIFKVITLTFSLTISFLPAKQLLSFILDKAKANEDISEIYLHVQISNDEAKNFYINSGFQQVDIIQDYYKNIDPPHCFLLSKIMK